MNYMQNNSQLGISDTGSLLMGVGLAKIAESVSMGLILVTVGVILKILVAVLQKQGIEAQSTGFNG